MAAKCADYMAMSIQNILFTIFDILFTFVRGLACRTSILTRNYFIENHLNFSFGYQYYSYYNKLDLHIKMYLESIKNKTVLKSFINSNVVNMPPIQNLMTSIDRNLSEVILTGNIEAARDSNLRSKSTFCYFVIDAQPFAKRNCLNKLKKTTAMSPNHQSINKDNQRTSENQSSHIFENGTEENGSMCGKMLNDASLPNLTVVESDDEDDTVTRVLHFTPTPRQRCFSECSDDFICFVDDDNDDKQVDYMDISSSIGDSDDSDDDDDICFSDDSNYDANDMNKDLTEINNAVPSIKKVRFNMKPQVLVMHTWNFAYRKARKGQWEDFARDRTRFQKRIDCAAVYLDPILNSEHRSKIYEDRFSQSKQE